MYNQHLYSSIIITIHQVGDAQGLGPEKGLGGDVVSKEDDKSEDDITDKEGGLGLGEKDGLGLEVSGVRGGIVVVSTRALFFSLSACGISIS